MIPNMYYAKDIGTMFEDFDRLHTWAICGRKTTGSGRRVHDALSTSSAM